MSLHPDNGCLNPIHLATNREEVVVPQTLFSALPITQLSGYALHAEWVVTTMLSVRCSYVVNL